uniref:C2H2-type domain-containing protein n=1 Tax=Heterorhabditis bacteriophora TaxID=37862 RepID=A0A1I7WFB2_HETBA
MEEKEEVIGVDGMIQGTKDGSMQKASELTKMPSRFIIHRKKREEAETAPPPLGVTTVLGGLKLTIIGINPMNKNCLKILHRIKVWKGQGPVQNVRAIVLRSSFCDSTGVDSLSPLYACASCGHFFIRNGTIFGHFSSILHTVVSKASISQVPRISLTLIVLSDAVCQVVLFLGHSIALDDICNPPHRVTDSWQYFNLTSFELPPKLMRALSLRAQNNLSGGQRGPSIADSVTVPYDDKDFE